MAIAFDAKTLTARQPRDRGSITHCKDATTNYFQHVCPQICREIKLVWSESLVIPK